MRHRVTKVIDFCYGHRLLDYQGQCRFLHGHNGRLEIDVESDGLDALADGRATYTHSGGQRLLIKLCA
jgi:6-pyruvoyl-tetrahydropterin synthase